MSRGSLTLSRSAVLHNFRLISRKVPKLGVIPMVKANAYGHGASFVAGALQKEKNVFAFGVATLKEGVELRLALSNSKTPIIVFSDASPWTENHAKLCLQYHLEPVFSEVMSMLYFQSSVYARRIAAHLEVNTGMNRLGIPLELLSLVNFYPKSIFTHLADAENPKARVTKQQMKGMTELFTWAKTKYSRALLHFSNSSAIWRAEDYPLTKQMDLARPGLSLYGIRPFEKAKDSGLKRVMTFQAPVINRIFLERGDQVGYGGSYTCKKARGEWAAILGVGYADGLFRSLSDQGVAVFKGKKLQLMGRVSMDLSAVRAPENLSVGEEVELWGQNVDPYEQAKLAGTIPYELTTRIGERLERNHED